jgi:pimeloyl-ACP methyl ester carboxylesterase
MNAALETGGYMITQMLPIRATDGFCLDVRLCLPENNVPDKIVIYVNGSGPMTYSCKRRLPDGTTFNYFDIFANEFTKRNIGFISYSQRGVTDGENPPFFADIDDEAYKTYLPSNSVSDISLITAYINENYPASRVILLGWSEGTIIAPLVAKNKSIKVDALMLAGYVNLNLIDILKWQLTGNSTLILWRSLFDYDKKGYITEEDYITDRNSVRQAMFGDTPFSSLDLDGDGKITTADTLPLAKPHLDNMLKAIEENDDEWLKNNHGIRLTSGWFKDHASLSPNSRVLPELDLPIHIFAGEYDFMTPIWQAQDIYNEFIRLGKTNLSLYTFEGHDHDLKILRYILKNEFSEGMKKLFDVAESI